MDSLEPNPDGCTRFEAHAFRPTRCRNCGHPWNMHRDAISEAQIASFSGTARQPSASERAAEAKAKAKSKAQAKARITRREQRAVEDNWLFDGVHRDETDSSDSDGQDGFRMILGPVVEAPPRALANAGTRIVNLIDFDECNPPPSEGGSSSTATSRGASATPREASDGGGSAQVMPCMRSACVSGGSASSNPPRAAAPSVIAAGGSSTPGRGSLTRGLPWGLLDRRCSGFSMPMQSKEDVLLEEIQYLRQMLNDTVEEKKIQISIVREEVTEKQRIIEKLVEQKAPAEAELRDGQDIETVAATVEQAALADARAAVRLEKLQEDLSHRDTLLDLRQEEIRRAQQTIEDQKQAFRKEADANRKELGEVQLGRCAAESELSQARVRILELSKATERLKFFQASPDDLLAVQSAADVAAWEEDLRNETQGALTRLADRHVALRVAAIAAQETSLCKICFDRPVACALIPCKHHAFCVPCGTRIRRAREPLCPLCRTPVQALFETYAG